MKIFFLKSLLAAGILTGFALPSSAKGDIVMLDTGIANVYLLKGPRPILVDTSAPGNEARIEEWLGQHGVKPKDLALIILTHGHGDHAGTAAYFAQKYQIPILAGRGDLPMLRAGHTDHEHVRPTSLLAGFLANFVPPDFPPVEPTQLIDQEISLEAYGYNARVLPLPGGHTPGSLAVIFDETGEALVGDLVRGDLFIPGLAAEHFFHEDRQLARWQLWNLIKQQRVKLLMPGHFEAFSSDEAIVKFFPNGRFAWP